MIVSLKNKNSGLIVQCKVGFSWTVFFFGLWVPVFRGMWSAAAITLFTFGLAAFYYMFKLNELYINKLLSEGFVAANEEAVQVLKANGVIIDYLPNQEVKSAA